MTKPVILCVDDEVVVLRSLKAQLKQSFGNNYNYELAEDANEALELIEELAHDNISIVLIVSDWLMPGMKGDELLIKVHQKFPNVVKIMLTGQADPEAIQRAKIHANLHTCLHKPWSETELVETIKSSLAKLSLENLS
jgi:CheY-like chemotaxis protein